jgi:hypothetical protein
VASRAEAVAAPRRHPGVRAALRTALSDFYFASIRLVAANVIWGVAVVVVVVIALGRPLSGLVLAPLLALPTAIVFATAGRVVRGGAIPVRRGRVPIDRRSALQALALGSVLVGVATVLGVNVALGLSRADPLGWALATLAAWGLVGLWCAALVGWPLVSDPSRADRPIRYRLEVAGRLLLLEPRRVAALGVVAAVVTTVSLVLTAAILTVSVAFVALVACRVVYPLADRLDPVEVAVD